MKFIKKIRWLLIIIAVIIAAYAYMRYTSLERTILREDEGVLKKYCLDMLERTKKEDFTNCYAFGIELPIPQGLRGPQPIEARLDARGNVCIVYKPSEGVAIMETPSLALVYSSRHIRPEGSQTGRTNFSWTHIRDNWYWMESN